MSIPIRLVTYPWFNDPRIHEHNHGRAILGEVISRSRHRRPLSKKQPRDVRSTHHHITSPYRTPSTRSPGESRVSLRQYGDADSDPRYCSPRTIVPGVPRRGRRRRRDEILGRQGASRRRDSPPPPSADRRTHHRDRTTLDESETYDDRRRLRVRDRASRDCGGGVEGALSTPREGVKCPARAA